MDTPRSSLVCGNSAVTHSNNAFSVTEDSGSAGSIRLNRGIVYGNITAGCENRRSHAVKAGVISAGGIIRIAENRNTRNGDISVCNKNPDFVGALRIHRICQFSILGNRYESIILTGKAAVAAGHSSRSAALSVRRRHSLGWLSHPGRWLPHSLRRHPFRGIADSVRRHLRRIFCKSKRPESGKHQA